ncbi:hypothetical protein [Aliiruegeria lutimaris]|uniref:Uncharacterized protein n=1 Tax=Aliiruegeria lutimaris TaxID=571298 RepID=A0A1G8N9H4_9RHOB|nr:hypothetical protein [Aliiruegeria lutimaris]SDI76828.1 hypothetical protein SAMN04488026_10076 [Aliiruegeria lutimaris]
MKSLIGLVAPLVLCAATAQADHDWCRTLFENTPDIADSALKVERTEYDTPGLGFGIRFDYPDPEALSVFFFDADAPEIDEALVEKYFFLGAQDVIRVNKSLGHRPKGKPRFERIELGDQAETVVFRMDLHTESDTQAFINDYLTIHGWGDCMVKMRLTGTEPDERAAAQRASEVLDRLITSLPAPSETAK